MVRNILWLLWKEKEERKRVENGVDICMLNTLIKRKRSRKRRINSKVRWKWEEGEIKRRKLFLHLLLLFFLSMAFLLTCAFLFRHDQWPDFVFFVVYCSFYLWRAYNTSNTIWKLSILLLHIFMVILLKFTFRTIS